MIQLVPSPLPLTVPTVLQLHIAMSSEIPPPDSLLDFQRPQSYFRPNFALTEYITSASSQDIKRREASGDGYK